LICMAWLKRRRGGGRRRGRGGRGGRGSSPPSLRCRCRCRRRRRRRRRGRPRPCPCPCPSRRRLVNELERRPPGTGGHVVAGEEPLLKRRAVHEAAGAAHGSKFGGGRTHAQDDHLPCRVHAPPPAHRHVPQRNNIPAAKAQVTLLLRVKGVLRSG